LLFGFAFLIILMIVIGLAGIWKIESLSKIIDVLGKRNLAIEKAVLEMKISNTAYAMGVRNFVLWQTSKYLGAVSQAANLDTLFKATDDFDKQLRKYMEYIDRPQQRQWAERLSRSLKEFRSLGEQIIDLAKQGQNTQEINKLLLAFENNFYKINEFLDETLAMTNFKEIDAQILLGYTRKQEAILLLSWVLFLGAVVGTGTSGWIYSRRKKERLRREVMVRQVITLEERERQNLSAQIHDQMAQDLSALKIYTGVIEQAIAQKNITQEVNKNVEQMKKILSGLMEKTHNICLLLRPPALDELGLIESLEALILEYKQLSGINYVYQKPDSGLQLPAEHSLLLYRLAQEALTNMAKYAKAKNAIIKLSQNSRGIEFTIEDDGSGFDYRSVIDKPRRRREDKLKLGLVGLQERVELLGGEMRIASSPGKGTRIVVQLSV